MAVVKAFRAVRPAPELADKVAALPYDVMNRKEAAEMAEGNPYSFLHICRSEIDLPQQEDPSFWFSCTDCESKTAYIENRFALCFI